MRSRLRSSALIEAWFDMLTPAQRDVARRLREAVLGAGPGLDETVKWGNLVFSAYRLHSVAIVAYREHLNLQVFNGAALRERHPALTGGRGQLRHLRCALGAPVDVEAVRSLVRDSVAAIEASAGAGRDAWRAGTGDSAGADRDAAKRDGGRAGPGEPGGAAPPAAGDRDDDQNE